MGHTSIVVCAQRKVLTITVPNETKIAIPRQIARSHSSKLGECPPKWADMTHRVETTLASAQNDDWEPIMLSVD